MPKASCNTERAELTYIKILVTRYFREESSGIVKYPIAMHCQQNSSRFCHDLGIESVLKSYEIILIFNHVTMANIVVLFKGKPDLCWFRAISLILALFLVNFWFIYFSLSKLKTFFFIVFMWCFSIFFLIYSIFILYPSVA